jgi:glycosyltransferase involved in cell wall biosynthesis
MSLKLSIIIPVYNTQKYIGQCLDSILNQSYKDLEVILVNDGSTDNSGKICDELSKKHKRIRVIHKENGGASDARNIGVKEAKGDYIVFVDSDDYWDGKNVIFDIVEHLCESSADILNFGYKKYFENKDQFESASIIGDRNMVVNKEKPRAFSYLVKSNLYISSPCAKVIKRSLILNNKISFEKGATSEDVEWSAKLAIFANSFDYYNKSFYVYRQRAGSMTKKMTIKTIKKLLRNIDLCISYGEGIKDTAFYNPYMGYVAYQYITSLANSYKLNLKDRKEIFAKLKSDSYLLEYSENKKVRTIYMAKKLLGFDIMYFVLKSFYSLKARRV